MYVYGTYDENLLFEWSIKWVKLKDVNFFDALKCTERYFEQQDNCSYVKINKRFCKNIVTYVIIPYGSAHSIPVN